MLSLSYFKMIKIKKMLAGFIFCILLLSVLALAQENAEVQQSGDKEVQKTKDTEEVSLPLELESLQQELVGKKLSGPLGSLFGNQRINFYLELDNGETLVAGIIIEKKTVKNIQIAEVSNPTLEVRTTETVLRSALQSPAPASTLRRALKDKQITVKGLGFVNKLKFKVASGLVSLTGLFNKEEVAPVAVVSRENAGIPQEKKQVATDDVVSDGVEKKEEKETEVVEKVAETAKVPEDSGPKTHTVALITGGFAVPSLDIKVGDTVIWENVRDGAANKGGQKALILGTQKCARLKSKFFMPGESFSWTFDAPLTCLVVDGIYTTQSMKVIVTK